MRAKPVIVLYTDDSSVRAKVGDLLALQFPGMHLEVYPTSQAVGSAVTRAIGVVMVDCETPAWRHANALRDLLAGLWDVPVIGMVSRDQISRAREALDLGMSGLVWKPLDRDEVRDACRHALAIRRLRLRLAAVDQRLARLEAIVNSTAEAHPRAATAGVGSLIQPTLTAQALDVIHRRRREGEHVAQQQRLELAARIDRWRTDSVAKLEYLAAASATRGDNAG